MLPLSLYTFNHVLAAPCVLCRSRRKQPNHIREFRDVVFEDVVFDNNSSVTPY